MKYVTMTRRLAKNGWLVLIAVRRGQGQTEAKVYTALKMFWKTALSQRQYGIARLEKQMTTKSVMSVSVAGRTLAGLDREHQRTPSHPEKGVPYSAHLFCHLK